MAHREIRYRQFSLLFLHAKTFMRNLKIIIIDFLFFKWNEQRWNYPCKRSLRNDQRSNCAWILKSLLLWMMLQWMKKIRYKTKNGESLKSCHVTKWESFKFWPVKLIEILQIHKELGNFSVEMMTFVLDNKQESGILIIF